MANKTKSKKTSKIADNLAQGKKSLIGLVKDEDGFVSKETILKVGLSTVAALGVMGALSENSTAQHTNSFSTSGNWVNHTNQTYHCSY